MADLRYKVVVDDAEARRKLADLLKGTGVSSSLGGMADDAKKATAGVDEVRAAQVRLKEAQTASINALRQYREELTTQKKAQSDLQAQYLQGRITSQEYALAQKKIADAQKEAARQARETKKALSENREYNKLTAELNRLRNASKDALAELSRMERQGYKNSAAYKQLEASSRSLVAQTNQLDRTVKKIDVTVGQHQRNVGNYSDAIGMIAPQLSQFAGRLGLVAAGVAAVGQSFTSNLRIEPINQALKFTSGTATEFDRNLNFLRETTDRLGLEFISSAESFKLWQGAAKFSNMTAEESRRIFDSVANASAKMKLSNDQVQGTFLALSQIMSKGKVQAEELRGQLGERLPGAFSLAAKAMGVTEQELNKMLEKGEVIASDFLPRFADQLDIAFGNDKTERIEGMQASVNRLKNEFDLLWQSERATSFFTVLGDGFARMFKEINLMVNSKSWAEFKAIAFGGLKVHEDFIRDRDLTPGQRAVPRDFDKKSVKEQLALINETKTALDEVVKRYNEMPNAGYAHDRKHFSDKLAEMNRIYFGKMTGGKSTTPTDGGKSDNDKAERAAERAAEKSRQAMERQRSLQAQIDSLAEQSTRKQLSRDEEELASIRDKYQKMREEVDKFYRDPKNSGRKVDLGKLAQAEKFEISEAKTRRGTTALIKRLNEQKEIYSQYAAYVEENGTEVADRMFGAQAEIAKNYRKELQAQYDLIKDSTTQANIERAKSLQESMDAFDKEERSKVLSKYADALKLAETFAQKEFKIRKEHNDAIAALGDNASKEQKAALERSLNDQLRTLIESSPEFEKVMQDIDKSSQALLSNAFQTGKDTIIKLIDGMSKATESEKAALRKIFGDFFDKGIKDARLGNYQEIANMANVFGGLVDSSFQFAENLDKGFDAIGGMISGASQLTGLLGKFLNNGTLSGISGPLSIFGAAFGMIGSVSNFFNRKKEADNQRYFEQMQSASDRQLKMTEAVTLAIQQQVDLLNELYGAERLDKYAKSQKEIEANWKSINSQLSGKLKMTGDGFTDDILTKINLGYSRNDIINQFNVGSKKFTDALRIYYDAINGKYGTFNKLPDDIKAASDALAQLEIQIKSNTADASTIELYNQLKESMELYKEISNKFKEEVTGTSFSALLGNISNLFFNNGESSGDAWGKGFQGVMEDYIKSTFNREFLQGATQEFYDMYDRLAKDGLTDDERKVLQQKWDDLQKEGQAKLDQYQKDLGIDLGASSGSGVKAEEGITRITSEQASELTGLFRSTYDVNKQQLVVQRSLVAIANDNLAAMNAIQINTANTVDRLDKAVSHLQNIDRNLGSRGVM